MALFIGIDPDVARPSAAAVELDLEQSWPAGPGARPRLRSVCLVRTPEAGDIGLRQLSNVELAIREMVRCLPPWLTALTVLPEFSLGVVEATQPHYGGHGAPNWNSLLRTAEVTGAAAAIVRVYCGCEVLTPTTQEWKRSTPKDVSHARAYDDLGILHKSWPPRKGEKRVPFRLPGEEERAVLSRLSLHPTNPGDWEDISDSVALALWAARRTQEAVAAVMKRKVKA